MAEFVHARVAYRDGSRQDFMTVTTRSDLPAGEAALGTLDVVQLGNGLLCGTNTYTELTKALARREFAVVTHQDPLSCYGVECKAARAEQVTARAARWRPLCQVEYSHAGLIAAVNGDRLIQEGRIAAMAFVAAAGITRPPGIPEDFQDVDWRVQRHAVGLLLGEDSAMGSEVRAARAGWRASMALRIGGVVHGVRSWSQLVAEAHEAFTTDERATYADFSTRVACNVTMYQNDTYFPADAALPLLAQAGFRSRTPPVSAPGAHATPLFNPVDIQGVCEQVEALVHPVYS